MWRMPTDQFSPEQAGQPEQRPVRDVADGYVLALADLDPILATTLGLHPGEHRLPDFSPDGQAAADALARTALAELAAARPAGLCCRRHSPPPRPLRIPRRATATAAERRCARLLRERLGAELAAHEAGEGLRAAVQPVQPGALRPPGVHADADGHRGRTGPSSPAGWRGCPRPTAATARRLEEGARRGLLAAAAPGAHRRRPARRVAGRPVLRRLASPAARALRAELDAAARAADEAVAEMRDFLRDEYAPRAEGTPDAVGRERYAPAARRWTGSDLGAGLGLEEAYAWGWSEHRRILAEQRIEAEKVLPGATADGGHALAGRRTGRRSRAWRRSARGCSR